MQSKNIKVYRDLRHKYQYQVKQNVIKCIATTNYLINNDVSILMASGKAKCSPEDKFDYRFGCELAKARAKQKLAIKIEKLLKSYSNTKPRKTYAINYAPEPFTFGILKRGNDLIINMIRKDSNGNNK